MNGLASIKAPLTLSLLVLSLAGCGGGSGGGNGSIDDGSLPVTNNVQFPTELRTVVATGDLTTTNYLDVGGPLFGVIRNLVQGGGIGPAGVVKQPSAGDDRPYALGEPLVAGPCAIGGGIIVTTTDADGNGRISVGDYIEVTAQDCQDADNLAPLTGKYRATYAAVDFSANGTVAASDITVTIDPGGLTLEGYGIIEGSTRIWSRSEGTSLHQFLRYDTTISQDGTEPVVYSVDLDRRLSLTGDTTRVGGGFSIQGQTFSASAAALQSSAGLPPSSGALIIGDASGDQLRLNAVSAEAFDVELLPGGAAPAAAAQTGLLWTNFGNQF
ncbi:MAG: hypothetical protein ABI696_06740 [Rubrivivax sp.]